MRMQRMREAYDEGWRGDGEAVCSRAVWPWPALRPQHRRGMEEADEDADEDEEERGVGGTRSLRVMRRRQRSRRGSRMEAQ